MHLTEKQISIYNGKICPYCGKDSVFVEDSSVFYGDNYGPVWACVPCHAWVGCHNGTTKAKGRLANKSLRQLKIAAHAAFDKIWKTHLLSRKEAYWWLSIQLGISKDFTHIGWFNEWTCIKVIALCEQFFIKNKLQHDGKND